MSTAACNIYIYINVLEDHILLSYVDRVVRRSLLYQVVDLEDIAHIAHFE